MKVQRFFVGILALCLMVASGLFSGKAMAEGLKIGTISIQHVIDGSQAGQDARKVLEAKEKELKPKFEDEQEALKAQAKEIEKKGSVWSEEVRVSKEREYQKSMREYQLKVEDAQYEMKQLEKKVLDPIFKELQSAITDVGKRMELQMIFEESKSGGLLYADQSLNINQAVITELDARMATTPKN